MANIKQMLQGDVLRRVLMYYVLLVSLMMFVGGWISVGSWQDAVANILFLPVVLFIFMTWRSYRKGLKTEA